jgi:HEAT repeat protein
LKNPLPDGRFAAAYVVGERLLEWQDDLIPLLQDKSEAVRQGARRSLIILSFLALNPDEARRIRSRQSSGTATPLSKLNKPVDYGPQPGAKPVAQSQAVKQWKTWWDDHKARQLRTEQLVTIAGKEGGDTESERLAAELVQATPEHRRKITALYRDSKGVKYTEALALAIAVGKGKERLKLREALKERMTRMTEKTLGRYLEDEDAEIRRAAALGLAMKNSKTHLDALIHLLLDPQPFVERAAHAALRSLSGKDFGPKVNATEDEKRAAVKRWQQWWEVKRE